MFGEFYRTFRAFHANDPPHLEATAYSNINHYVLSLLQHAGVFPSLRSLSSAARRRSPAPGLPNPPLHRTTLSVLTTSLILYAIFIRNHCVITGNVVEGRIVPAPGLPHPPNQLGKKDTCMVWDLRFHGFREVGCWHVRHM